MKKVLVTGAAGFLGSHLARRLVAEHCLVVGIDNLYTGQLRHMEDMARTPLFQFLFADVSSANLAERDELWDAKEIYHLASPASPRAYQAAPFQTIDVNTAGTRNMLELARISGARLVFASTSEVYGDPEIHPQDERYCGNVNTWGPRACYDESKRLGEVYCYEYFTRFGVDVRVARIFNTYSAGLSHDDGRMVSNFVIQALTGQNITVYGKGEQTRSLCYLDDTIAALKLMMEKEEASGEIINIGSQEEHSVLEVALLVKQLTGSSSPIIFKPLPQDDPKQRRPAIDKAIKLLGWQPIVGLEEGLKRMIEAYRRQLAKGGRS